MKNSLILMTLFAGFITACQTKSPEEKADSLAAAPDTTVGNGKSCYAYIKNKDTVSLSMTKVGHDVTGNLDYNYYEKDKNTGTLTGQIKGDTLIADYTFMSEGTTTIRQVAFLIKDNQLTEGYGDAEEKNGKFVFKNTGKLNFTEGTTLSAIDCK